MLCKAKGNPEQADLEFALSVHGACTGRDGTGKKKEKPPCLPAPRSATFLMSRVCGLLLLGSASANGSTKVRRCLYPWRENEKTDAFSRVAFEGVFFLLPIIK